MLFFFPRKLRNIIFVAMLLSQIITSSFSSHRHQSMKPGDTLVHVANEPAVL